MSEASTLTKPIQRVIDVQANGYEALIFVLPMAGPRHFFNDHNHAKNFVRYLFSKSKAHPENVKTHLNFINEYRDGELVRRGFNNTPNDSLNDFIRRRFPATDGHLKLCDDGAYAAFALRLPSGKAYSSFIVSDGDKYCNHDGDFLYMLAHMGVEMPEIEKHTIPFAKRGAVEDFNSVTDKETMRAVEICIQGLVHKALRSQEDVLLTVSHRDQDDHNPMYHVHRLLRL